MIDLTLEIALSLLRSPSYRRDSSLLIGYTGPVLCGLVVSHKIFFGASE